MAAPKGPPGKKHKKTRAAQPPGSGPQAGPYPNSKQNAAEEAALDAFCNQIRFEEIPFETWEALDEDLDLTVPLFLSPEEAKTGGTWTVRFSRKDPSGGRRRAEEEVRVPPGSEGGTTLVLPGMGERAEDRRGDLRVIIRLRQEP